MHSKSQRMLNLDRRDVLRNMALVTAAASLAPTLSRSALAAAQQLSVLAPLPPDPAPPGDAKFALDLLEQWQQANSVSVGYESVAWPQLHDKIATNFASGTHVWDVLYMGGWVPEFARFLVPFVDQLPADLKSDMPASSFKTVTWDGKSYGTVFTLSLLTLFYNKEHFATAGLMEPPRTWDDLKRYAKELTRDGRYGFVLNYGDPAGVGGTASYWMVYLQQAGGKMYGENGHPVFNDAPGIDALQLMVDLFNDGTDPGSISYVGINDATNVMLSGRASMMMNWPFTWKAAQDPTTSQIVGKLGAAVLPAGPAGSASIDGTDAFSIAASSPDPSLARKLIEFYLSPDVQKQQALETGWLPIRLSVLEDKAIQEALPIAPVVLEQARSPYDSFITPDYTQVTQAIGTQVQLALQGTKTPKEAIADAADQVTDIVNQRG